jgi:hypothetical protein
MKTAILIFGAFITGLISLSTPITDIQGTWVMQHEQTTCGPTVIRINMDKGIWVGKVDIPEQQVYDQVIDDIRVDGDSVFIKVSENGNHIKAILKQANRMEGTLIADESEAAVQFTRK